MYDSQKVNTMVSALEIELVDVDEKTIILRMPITDKVRNLFKMLHGGAIMTLAESAASIHAT